VVKSKPERTRTEFRGLQISHLSVPGPQITRKLCRNARSRAPVAAIAVYCRWQAVFVGPLTAVSAIRLITRAILLSDRLHNAHTRDKLLRAQGWLLTAGTQLQQLMSSLRQSELPQSPSSGSSQSAAASRHRQLHTIMQSWIE
jgi:hypothetical protein